jgi:hypothetical protein
MREIGRKRGTEEARLKVEPRPEAVFDETELVSRMQLYYSASSCLCFDVSLNFLMIDIDRLFPFSAMFRWLSYGGGAFELIASNQDVS